MKRFEKFGEFPLREASAIYSLDLALVLHACSSIELAVLNPKVVCRFAETLRCSKTNPADALVLQEYSRRKRWQPPSASAMALRSITRRFGALTSRTL